jgi:hypothetical protein
LDIPWGVQRGNRDGKDVGEFREFRAGLVRNDVEGAVRHVKVLENGPSRCVLNDLGLRNGRQNIDGSDSCRRGRRGLIITLSIVVIEHRVVIVVLVSFDVLVVKRGVDDNFFLLVAL